MRVVVTGDFREPILLDSKKATGIVVYSDDNRPNVIYRIVKDGQAWIRYTKGEDECFNEIATSLGILK
jgi:hypothetical protein